MFVFTRGMTGTSALELLLHIGTKNLIFVLKDKNDCGRASSRAFYPIVLYPDYSSLPKDCITNGP